MLTREQILAVSDLARETIAVPEWGGEVCVRCMTGAERDAFDAARLGEQHKPEAERQFRSVTAAATLCDAEGKLLFTAADVQALAGKSGAALDRVFEAAVRLNRLGAAQEEQARKNS